MGRASDVLCHVIVADMPFHQYESHVFSTQSAVECTQFHFAGMIFAGVCIFEHDSDGQFKNN